MNYVGHFQIINLETNELAFLPPWLEDQIHYNSTIRHCHVLHENIVEFGYPSLYCDWTIDQIREGSIVVWNGTEKTKSAEQWIQFIIDTYLVPNGYGLKDGSKVTFVDESYHEAGEITANGQRVTTKYSL